MYIRTPKKYRGTQRRGLVSFRRILFWVIALAIIVFGIYLFVNREVIQPRVHEVIMQMKDDLEQGVATAMAPTSTPVPDPRDKLVTADNYWRGGSVDEAIAIYKQVADATPNDSDVFERIALGAIIAGETGEAVDFGERAVLADPYSSDAWAILGWAYDWDNQPREAIPSLLQALDLDPDNLRAKSYLAEAYFTAGQTQRAYDLANEVLEDNPDSAEAYRARGLITWTGFFDLDTALEDFETAYNIARDSSPALMTFMAIDIARIEYNQQNYERAIEILEGVLEVNPANSRVLYWLGFIYNAGIGDPNQASTYLSRCLDFNPDYPDCQYYMGRIQYRNEEYQLASESFSRAIDLGSTNPYHYYWAGWSQINLGNCNRALTYLEPGYQIALDGIDEDIIDAFETVIPDCDVNFTPSV